MQNPKGAGVGRGEVALAESFESDGFESDGFESDGFESGTGEGLAGGSQGSEKFVGEIEEQLHGGSIAGKEGKSTKRAKCLEHSENRHHP
jgi:hypothetical protein